VLRENRVPTTPKGIEEVFGKIPPNRIALETVTHSPWVSRQLTRWGHEVIVAHARNVRLIGDSSRKDDRLDAWTLARLASINPQLVGAGATPQCRGTNPSDGNPRSSGAGQWSHGIGECGTRLTKSYGERLQKCGTQQMNRETAKGLSQELRDALDPLERLTGEFGRV
jgi:transposase